MSGPFKGKQRGQLSTGSDRGGGPFPRSASSASSGSQGAASSPRVPRSSSSSSSSSHTAAGAPPGADAAVSPSSSSSSPKGPTPRASRKSKTSSFSASPFSPSPWTGGASPSATPYDFAPAPSCDTPKARRRHAEAAQAHVLPRSQSSLEQDDPTLQVLELRQELAEKAGQLAEWQARCRAAEAHAEREKQGRREAEERRGAALSEASQLQEELQEKDAMLDRHVGLLQRLHAQGDTDPQEVVEELRQIWGMGGSRSRSLSLSLSAGEKLEGRQGGPEEGASKAIGHSSSSDAGAAGSAGAAAPGGPGGKTGALLRELHSHRAAAEAAQGAQRRAQEEAEALRRLLEEERRRGEEEVAGVRGQLAEESRWRRSEEEAHRAELERLKAMLSARRTGSLGRRGEGRDSEGLGARAGGWKEGEKGAFGEAGGPGGGLHGAEGKASSPDRAEDGGTLGGKERKDEMAELQGECEELQGEVCALRSALEAAQGDKEAEVSQLLEQVVHLNSKLQGARREREATVQAGERALEAVRGELRAVMDRLEVAQAGAAESGENAMRAQEFLRALDVAGVEIKRLRIQRDALTQRLAAAEGALKSKGPSPADLSSWIMPTCLMQRVEVLGVGPLPDMGRELHHGNLP